MKIQPFRQFLAVIALSAVLSGCAGDQPEGSQALRQLPTVTAVVATKPPAATPLPATRTVTRPTATAIPTPSAVPQIVETADGPLTPSMVELKLGAERYATLGDPAAPITIVEFSDFGCPSCREFELTTFGALKETYIATGKVYYVYKDFPVVSQQGGLAAEAAECAGAQGRYWEMHHQLFRSPQEWGASQEAALLAFQIYAETIGIAPDLLAQCLSVGEQRPDVDADFGEGMALGISGTPSFLINGKLLAGAQSLAIFSEILDQELQSR